MFVAEGFPAEDVEEEMTDTRILILIVALFLAAGCLESNPQPSPVGDGVSPHVAADTGGGELALPGVDEQKVYASAVDDSKTMFVVGEEEAANGASGCYAAEPDSEDDADDGWADVNENGSFVLVVPDVKVPVIILTFRYPDTDELQKLEIEVPSLDDSDDDGVWAMSESKFDVDNEEDPNSRPTEYDGWQAGVGGGETVMAVTMADDTTAEVVGGPFSVTPLAVVAVVNLSQEVTSIVSANNVGEFVAAVPAAPGDELSVFSINPSDHAKASAPVFLTVP